MNMALLGLSLVIVSLSCLIYHSPSNLWRSIWQKLALLRPGRLPLLTEEEKTTKPPVVDRKTKLKDDPMEKSEPLEHKISVPTTPKADNASSRSSPSSTVYSPSRRKLSSGEFIPRDASTSPSRQTPPHTARAPPTKPPAINPPTPEITQTPPTASQAMPPPPRPAAATPHQQAPSPSPTPNTLRIPTTGPLPNRGPPAPSTLRSPSAPNTLLAPSTSTLPPPGRPRQKVILKPGHSPLDWAQLTRSHPNLAGVPHLQRVTPALLAWNNGRKGRPAWSLFRGRVYNVSPYLPFHPGGEGELMRGAGKDAEKMFVEVHPWVNWENMLGGCLVGMMVAEGEGNVDALGGGSELDEMD